jgi:hypothetical protein
MKDFVNKRPHPLEVRAFPVESTATVATPEQLMVFSYKRWQLLKDSFFGNRHQ